MKPKFSIVIPSKYPSEEIYATLKSLINQPSNIEVIVSDAANCTRLSEFIRDLNDKRFSYYRRSSALSFSEDWEQALSHVSGTYVTILGDDDTFVSNSISSLNSISEEYDAIMWDKANYCWPNHIKEERRNNLSLKSGAFSLVLSPQRLLLLARNFFIGYARLPSIYNSFVHINVINKTKQNTKNGLFFGGVIPDVHSAIAISHFSNSILYLGYPVTINGASSRSSGVIQGKAEITPSEQLQVRDAFEAYKIYPEPANIYSQSISTIFLGEYLLFSKGLLYGSLPKPNLKNYLAKLYEESPNYDSPASILRTADLTSSFLGVKPRKSRCLKSKTDTSKNTLNEVSTIKLPEQYLCDVLGASKLLDSLIPEHTPKPLSFRQYMRMMMSKVANTLKITIYLGFCTKRGK